jgi:hypothetical protein
MNPELMTLEYFCSSPKIQTFSPCNSANIELVGKELNKRLTEGLSGLFGFLAPKESVLVFKTLDAQTSKSTTGEVGAECGNVSNMDGHRKRVIAFQEAAPAELADYMLEDDPSSWDKRDPDLKRRQAEMKPRHINDFTQKNLCFYMEWVARILNARRVNGQRWFLTGSEALIAGLKGRKPRR